MLVFPTFTPKVAQTFPAWDCRTRLSLLSAVIATDWSRRLFSCSSDDTVHWLPLFQFVTLPATLVFRFSLTLFPPTPLFPSLRFIFFYQLLASWFHLYFKVTPAFSPSLSTSSLLYFPSVTSFPLWISSPSRCPSDMSSAGWNKYEAGEV